VFGEEPYTDGTLLAHKVFVPPNVVHVSDFSNTSSIMSLYFSSINSQAGIFYRCIMLPMRYLFIEGGKWFETIPTVKRFDSHVTHIQATVDCNTSVPLVVTII
jgi:hypothetical protein